MCENIEASFGLWVPQGPGKDARITSISRPISFHLGLKKPRRDTRKQAQQLSLLELVTNLTSLSQWSRIVIRSIDNGSSTVTPASATKDHV
jgi:hypothetical protein